MAARVESTSLKPVWCMCGASFDAPMHHGRHRKAQALSERIHHSVDKRLRPEVVNGGVPVSAAVTLARSDVVDGAGGVADSIGDGAAGCAANASGTASSGRAIASANAVIGGLEDTETADELPVSLASEEEGEGLETSQRDVGAGRGFGVDSTGLDGDSEGDLVFEAETDRSLDESSDTEATDSDKDDAQDHESEIVNIGTLDSAALFRQDDIPATATDGPTNSSHTGSLSDVLRPIDTLDRNIINFMLTSSNGAGLSGKDRKNLFDFVKAGGLMRQFESSHALWSDFERRFIAVQHGIGNFVGLPIHFESFLKGTDAKTGEEARVRNLKLSIMFIFDNLCHTAKHGSADEQRIISDHMRYEAQAQVCGPLCELMDTEVPRREYGSIWSGDAALRLQYRCRSEDTWSSQDGAEHPLGPVCLLLVSLFIDKHNVTKMNKRSLYSVVMFIKNIDSGPLQFLDSLIVAYIPFPSSQTDLGTRLTEPKTRRIRRMAVQQTMKNLLGSATSGGAVFTMLCPDSKVRRFRIGIMGNADHPEVCMQTGGRSGTGLILGSAMPDPQCNMQLRHSEFFMRPDDAALVLPRTAVEVLAIYQRVSLIKTLDDQERMLKENSLNTPPSAWLEAPFVSPLKDREGVLQVEPDVIPVPVRSIADGRIVERSMFIAKFGFQNLFPFEYLHNYA